MSALGTPPPLTVVHPGEGRAANLGSIGAVFKLWGEDGVSIIACPPTTQRTSSSPTHSDKSTRRDYRVTPAGYGESGTGDAPLRRWS
jgi:hypothetical protein